MEETLRERLRAAEADRDRIQGRLRDAVAKPASPVYTSAESTLRDRLAAAEADRERLHIDGDSIRRERDALRAAAAEDRAALEETIATLSKDAEQVRRDVERRAETEAALRRENQKLRADAELLTPRTGKEILAARLEKATAELNSAAGEREKLRAAADEHHAAAEALRGRLVEAEAEASKARDKRQAGDALRSAAEEARREAASLLKKLDCVEAARMASDAKARSAEAERAEAFRQRDDAVAEAARWQDCAEDAEARCSAAEKAAEKSASAAAEAISKARYAAKDLEKARNELAPVVAARDELAQELAEKTAELEEAGRLAAEVDRLRREVEATKSEASTALKEELAAARHAVEKKDAELASIRESHATRLREAEEQLATAAKATAAAKADAIYSRAEAQAAQQRPSPGTLQRAESRCEALQRDLEVAQNDWAAERDRLRDARDAQRDRYEELKQRIDEGDEASAIALEHAERRADAASAELEDRERQLAEARSALQRVSETVSTNDARDARHAEALEDMSRPVWKSKFRAPHFSHNNRDDFHSLLGFHTGPGNWSSRGKSSVRQSCARTWLLRVQTFRRRRRRRSWLPLMIFIKRSGSTSADGKQNAPAPTPRRSSLRNCGRPTATSRCDLMRPGDGGRRRQQSRSRRRRR